MSLEELDAHRKAIAFDVEVILDGYWDRRPPADVKAGILSDWCDALEDWSKEQILFVLRDWRAKKPSNKPNPGHIVKELKEMRGHAEVARSLAQPKPVDATPERGPVSAEMKTRADDISAYFLKQVTV